MKEIPIQSEDRDPAPAGKSIPVRSPKRLRRIGFVIAVFTMLTVGLLSFMWLHEIGIFDIGDGSLASIVDYKPNDNSLVYDRDNKIIGEFFTRYYVFIPYEKLPNDLIKAVVAIEDRSFFEHSGIDLRGITRAAVSHLRNDKRRQGASTITQQVIRHFLLTKEKTIERKIKEAALAIYLESQLSKEQILELYTNVLFLGNRAFGVGAAAKRYFGRDIQDLQSHELALIAGLFQSPSRYNPSRFPKRAKRRQLQVIRAMQKSGMISLRKAKKMARAPLRYQTYNPMNLATAPYFLDYIRERTEQTLGRTNIKNQGLRIYTTLDSRLQKMVQESFEENKEIFALAERLMIIPPHERTGPRPVEGAMLVSNPENGEILAMRGGRNYADSQFNRAIHAIRQPGSAFKPVIYSLALSRGYKWSDLMYVSPVAVRNYRPRNFSKSFLTETTMMRAFYKSINTPVVAIGNKIGLRDIIEHGKKLGISSEIRDEAGSMLGASGLTLTDMATMYNTFAREGKRTGLIAITRITDRDGNTLYEAPTLESRTEEVISKQDAYLMTAGMQAVFRYGTAYKENEMGQYAAGKTGTSNGSRDNWFAGFTPNLNAVVWVGSDKSREFLGKATGTSLALPIWATFMKKAIKAVPPRPFTMPKGITMRRVHSQFGHNTSSGVKMYFKKGQVPVKTASDLKILSDRGQYRSLFNQN